MPVRHTFRIAMQQKHIAVPGFEPGLPDSESGVLTTTLYRRCGYRRCENAKIAKYIQSSTTGCQHFQERIVPKMLTEG